MKVKAIGIIPARYESSRFPGKPLARIAGKSMIRRVWENASTATSLAKVIVATDSPLIKREADMNGSEVVMTKSDLPSGTDRVYAAYKALNEPYDIVVNIQGDEPLLRGELIDELVIRLANSDADVATLIRKIHTREELLDPSVVKVALSADSTGIYFSRSAIPFMRDAKTEDWHTETDYYRHIGIYAYRIASLVRFVALPPSRLEKMESLEQLRLIEAGAKYLCVETDAALAGVDFPKDIEIVEQILKKSNKRVS